MDYQFFGTQNTQFIPAYQAAPLPLTPGHSASEGEFHSPPTDPMTYEFNGDHMAFDNAGAFHHHHHQQQQQQQSQQPAFNGAALPGHNAFAPTQPPAAPAAAASVVHNGPPTPPTHHNAVGHNAFQQQQAKQQQHTQSQQSIVADFSQNLIAKAESSPEDLQLGGSDNEDLTPAQNRRKAQNRAAQRAFRERKEKHVKDLEAKLATLEATQKQTSSENERLKRHLQKMSTENEILRATTSLAGPPNGGVGVAHTTAPMHYNPTDFYSNVLSGHANKTPSHRIVESDNGERLYAAGATWDLIINHGLYKQGRVDIGDVSDRLKSQAKCDGQGPVFEERSILEAIEASVASGSDELL